MLIMLNNKDSELVVIDHDAIDYIEVLTDWSEGTDIYEISTNSGYSVYITYNQLIKLKSQLQDNKLLLDCRCI